MGGGRVRVRVDDDTTEMQWVVWPSTDGLNPTIAALSREGRKITAHRLLDSFPDRDFCGLGNRQQAGKYGECEGER